MCKYMTIPILDQLSDACGLVVCVSKSSGLFLDIFNFVNELFLVRIPDGIRIFKEGSD